MIVETSRAHENGENVFRRPRGLYKKMWLLLRLKNNLVPCDSGTLFRLGKVVLERSVRFWCHDFQGEEDVLLQPALPMLSRSRAW